jgi:hypothetical protein
MTRDAKLSQFASGIFFQGTDCMLPASSFFFGGKTMEGTISIKDS